MKWEIDLQMKDGQIARSYDDNGGFCTMESIEAKEQTVTTLFGPVIYEFAHSKHKYLVPSYQPVASKPLMKPNWYQQITIWVLFFIGVSLFTFTLIKIWELLF